MGHSISKKHIIPSQHWDSRGVIALLVDHHRDVLWLDLAPSHMQHTNTRNEHALSTRDLQSLCASDLTGCFYVVVLQASPPLTDAASLVSLSAPSPPSTHIIHSLPDAFRASRAATSLVSATEKVVQACSAWHMALSRRSLPTETHL